MTEPNAQRDFPVLVVDYDDPWLNVDLEADPKVWAAAQAELLLAATPGRSKGAAVSQLADLLASAVGLATRVPDSVGLYLLCPSHDLRVRAIVKLVAVELDDEAMALGIETARALVAPADLRLAEPADVRDIETPAGPAARGRLRIVDESPERLVTELLNYAWVFPGYRFAGLLGTAFTDLLEGGRWRPAVDALVAGFALAPASDSS